jgi:hypothetical protein
MAGQRDRDADPLGSLVISRNAPTPGIPFVRPSRHGGKLAVGEGSQMMRCAVFVCLILDGDRVVSFLSQTPEKLPEILRKQFRLLHSCEMAALWHLRPTHNIQAALCKCTRRHRNFFGK